MKDFFRDLSLYFSAFVPMYVLVFVKLIVEIINSNLTFNVLNTLNFVTLLLLISFGVVGLVWNLKFSAGKSMEIEIISAQNITDKHFLGYFSLFVFFAIPLDLALVSAFCVYMLVLVMIGIVYITNSLFYINPLLNLLGFSFYDITYFEIESTPENDIQKTAKNENCTFEGEKNAQNDEKSGLFNEISPISNNAGQQKQESQDAQKGAYDAPEKAQGVKSVKIFCRGKLSAGQRVCIQVKNQHFCFVDAKGLAGHTKVKRGL